MPRLQRRLVARARTQPRVLVDVQPDAVPHAVDIAHVRPWVAHGRRMPLRRKIVTRHHLEVATRHPQLERRHRQVENLLDLVPRRLYLIGRIPQRPGARQVVKIAAAAARKNVEDDALPQPQRHRRVAAVMRHARVAALAKDRAVVLRQPVDHHPAAHKALHVADGQGFAVRLDHRLSAGAVALDKLLYLAHRQTGQPPGLQHLGDLPGVLRLARQRKQRVPIFAHQLHTFDLVLQPGEQRQRCARVQQPIDAQSPQQPKIANHPAQIIHSGRGAVTVVLLQQLILVIGLVAIHQRQPGTRGRVALHAAVDQRQRFAPTLEHYGVFQMRAAGQIIHHLVPRRIAQHQQPVQVTRRHQAVQVGFHRSPL